MSTPTNTSPNPSSTAAKAGSKSSPLTIVLIILILVAGGGGWYGGMQYQKSKGPTLPNGASASQFRQRFGNINGNFRNQFANGGAVRGEVTAIQGGTLTVKLTDGSSKLVILGSSAAINKTATAAVSDITVGTTIQAIGTANSDGSVTATTVDLNPASGGFPGVPGGTTPAQ